VAVDNKLDRSIKERDSVESFKYHLRKAKCLTKNKLYPKFSGAKAINHTRLRLGLSSLKAHRYAYNHIPTANCGICGACRDDSSSVVTSFTVPKLA
jgi:hypothetical protein